MPYKTRVNSSRRPQLLMILILLAIIAAVLALTHHHNKPLAKTPKQPTTTQTAGTVDLSPATPADNKANEDRKSKAATSDTLDTTSPSSTSFTVTILNARVITDDNNNRVVHVGNQVDGVKDGTCTLTAKKSGQSNVTDTASVKLDVNTYTCGVFNLPVSNFPVSGTWNLTLTVTNKGSNASATSTITI